MRYHYIMKKQLKHEGGTGLKRMLLLLLVMLAAVPALAEAPVLTAVPPLSQVDTATPTPVPATATPAPTAAPTAAPVTVEPPASAATPAPVLVDRINSPKVHADFAFAPDAQLLEVYFPQVLSADAAYLRFGGETMMIDCATAELAVRITDMFTQLGFDRVDRMINTHPHPDHIGGLQAVHASAPVGELWICFDRDVNEDMTAAVAFADEQGIAVKTYADGDVLYLGGRDGVRIEACQLPAGAVNPDAERGTDEMNNRSMQLKLTYGQRTLMFSADLLGTGQRALADLEGDWLDVDILKYPHHGKERLAQNYQDAVSPLYLVVTNNLAPIEGYKYIRATRIPAAWTVPGFVRLTTDGTTWVVDRVPSAIRYR